VQDGLHHVFGLRIDVSNAASGALPRFEMKARRVDAEV